MRNKPIRLWMLHLSPCQSCCCFACCAALAGVISRVLCFARVKLELFLTAEREIVQDAVDVPSGGLLEVATSTTPLSNSVWNSCFRTVASATSLTWWRKRSRNKRFHPRLPQHMCDSEVKLCSRHSMLISVVWVCSFTPLYLVTATCTHKHART